MGIDKNPAALWMVSLDICRYGHPLINLLPEVICFPWDCGIMSYTLFRREPFASSPEIIFLAFSMLSNTSLGRTSPVL